MDVMPYHIHGKSPIFPHKVVHIDDNEACLRRSESRRGALVHFWRNKRSRNLRADPACINQADNDEKRVQIPLMSRNYRNAPRMLCS